MINTRVLTRDIGSPLYHQVYHILRSGILSGRHPVGTLLDPEEAIASDFSVSRVTVRKAMQALEAEGLIERKQGRGTRVLQAGSAFLPSGARQLSVPPAPSSIEIPVFETVEAGPEIAAWLDLAPGTPAFRFVRLRRRGRVPVRVLTGYVPCDVAPGLTADELLAAQTLSDAFDRRHLAWHSIEDEIGALIADRTIASLLQVKVGAAVVEIFRTVRDEQMRPLAYQQVHMPPERDKVRIRLDRDQAQLVVW